MPTRYNVMNKNDDTFSHMDGSSRVYWHIPLLYEFPSNDVAIGQVFVIMNSEARKYGIIEWNFKQSSLHDVFTQVCQKYQDQ